MATNRTFQAMLNDFLPNDLLKEELIKRDYVLSNIEKDDTWIGASSATGNGGNLIVPFKAAGASSVAMGSLSASNDIAQDLYVRGTITTQKEAWGSMIFNHRDLMEHEQVSEKNFLKILPDSINDFMDYMRNVVSVNLLNGPWFASLTADATSALGVITVDRPDRFVIAQKVIVQDSVNSMIGYVSVIDINNKLITLVTQRGGSTPVSFASAGTQVLVANGGKCYNDGAQVSGQAFESLRMLMLSAANGGDTQIYGVTKTLYPYTQAININGAGCTASNFVQKLFDGYTQTRLFGKGAPTDLLMSYRNWGLVIKIVEASKGAFNVVADSKKASQYGWTEIMIGSVTSQPLKFVGIQEMDDDIVIFMDWRAAKFYSNGFFRKRKSPDGIEYFEVRATTGFQYIVDVCLFGEIVLQRPSYCGIMYGISIPYGF
jgi:hypothetical protein